MPSSGHQSRPGTALWVTVNDTDSGDHTVMVAKPRTMAVIMRCWRMATMRASPPAASAVLPLTTMVPISGMTPKFSTSPIRWLPSASAM